MMYGVDCKRWVAIAKRYKVIYTDTELGEYLESLTKDEEQVFDRISELDCLIMDETEEAYTQEWRENLSKEEAAAVAVLDREVDGNLERMWLDLADKVLGGVNE